MGGVFINYRVVDNPLGAAGIHDALAGRFGADKVFRDCVSLEAGTVYPDAIRDALASSEVLLSIIGPDWLALTDDTTGERLIDREYDWVRRELMWAHERDIHVVPVLLVDTPADAVLPKPDELPPDLRWFAHRQAFRFSQLTFGVDLERLAKKLNKLAPGLTSNGRRRPAPDGGQLSPADFAELVTALEAIPCIQNDDTRSLLLRQLRPTISGAIPHYSQRRAHVMGILTTCLNYEHGLSQLVEAIGRIERSDSVPYQRLLEILTYLFPDASFEN
jgi:Effector-associated domain 2